MSRRTPSTSGHTRAHNSRDFVDARSTVGHVVNFTKRGHVVRKTALFSLGLLLQLVPLAAKADTFYASPSGGGDGLSESTPFQIADFFGLASAGDVLVLLDGHYTGDNSMITPPENLSGTEGNPITVRAQHDGAVDIDGEDARHPINLLYTDWWIVEGVNAHNAGGDGLNNSTVSISYSSHCILRRIVAWDAEDGNTNVFGVHHGDYNLVEDCAGFGVARKVFSNAQEGNFTTFRRCWGRWEGSHVEGPKNTFSIAYNSYDGLIENCIGTWDSIRMRESYTVTDYFGVPGESFTNYEVQAAQGIFSHAGMDTDMGYPLAARARVLGSLSYIPRDARFSNSFRVWFGPLSMSDPEIQIFDMITVVEPGGDNDVYYPFHLEPNGTPGASSATNITAIGVADMNVSDEWTLSNVYNSHSCDGIIAGGGNVLNPSIAGVTGGGTMMNRIVDGELTSEPLWPWPMNQRIIDGMTAAGRTPVDVTRTAFELCGGTLPAEFTPEPVDGGIPRPDGGTSQTDASVPGSDSGTPGSDASTAGGDGGGTGAAPASGCGCVVASSASSTHGFFALLAVGLIAVLRRSRSKRTRGNV